MNEENKMDNVKKLALQKGIALLSASGARFAVLTADGNTFGDLPIVPPKAPALQPKWTQKNRFQQKYKYLDVIKNLKAGESAKFTVTQDEIKAFQSALAGSGGRFFGAGNYMTARNGLSCEILRVQ